MFTGPALAPMGLSPEDAPLHSPLPCPTGVLSPGPSRETDGASLPALVLAPTLTRPGSEGQLRGTKGGENPPRDLSGEGLGCL